MEKEYAKMARTKAFLTADTSVDIGSIVKQQRRKFSRVEAHSILFPEIGKASKASPYMA